MPKHRIVSFLGLLALGGCTDPLATDTGPTDDVTEPDADVPTAGIEPTRSAKRRTLVRDRNGKVVELEVTVRNGLAFVDGDMLIGREDELVEPGSGAPRANVLAVAGDLWPSHIIPYDDSDLEPAGRVEVAAAIARWEAATSFRFIPRTTQTDYIEFVDDDEGCYSWVGNVGYGQNINLEAGVCTRGNAMHEIGHALGLYHEHQRADRNNFVMFFGSDLPIGSGANYDIDGTRYGTFDFGSMMLYHSFTTDSNNPVMLARDRWSFRAGGNALWADFRTSEREPLGDVRFGDFDGNGTTDALKNDNGITSIARGVAGTPGVQPQWTFHAAHWTSLADTAVGRFDGVAGDDLFRADGTGWYISSGGSGPWVKINSSTTPLYQLYLGDFNGDGWTDVMRPDGTSWHVSDRGRASFALLNSSGYSHGSIAVGSFDTIAGDDILITTGSEWRYASGGRGRSVFLQASTVLAKDMILGKFDSASSPLTDVVYPGGQGRYDISVDARGRWQQFAGVSGFQGTPPPANMQIADINNDGRDDILYQGVFFGQRSNLSPGDVAAIQALYFGTWQVSRGGNSSWQYLNETNVPMSQVALCDFDNDGIDDVFRADGTKWTMSKSGSGSWITLNASAYRLHELALGDFDNDGRCDVLRTDGARWWMSKSGTGTWVQRNTSARELDELKFADLDGNGSTDAFLATGTEWYVSWGAASPYQKLNSSAVTDVLLADMDNDGAADVFHATGTHFQYSKSGKSSWITLNTSGHAMSEITLADFDGDGRADVFRPDGTKWWISRNGTGAWQALNTSGYLLPALRIGKLDTDRKADVLTAFPRFAQ